MDQYYDQMFSIPFFHIRVDKWDYKKNELMKLLEQSDLEKNIDHHTDYHKQVREEWKNSNIKVISSILEDELISFSKYFSFSSIAIKSSWFEVSKKYEFHGAHSHGSTGYVAVCYLQYNIEEHKPLVFISPFKNFINGFDLHYEPKNLNEGSIIFFPSSIMHQTRINNSNLDRIVVTLNLDVF